MSCHVCLTYEPCNDLRTQLPTLLESFILSRSLAPGQRASRLPKLHCGLGSSPVALWMTKLFFLKRLIFHWLRMQEFSYPKSIMVQGECDTLIGRCETLTYWVQDWSWVDWYMWLMVPGKKSFLKGQLQLLQEEESHLMGVGYTTRACCDRPDHWRVVGSLLVLF